MVILSINLVSFSLYNYPLKGGLSLKKSRLLSVFFKFSCLSKFELFHNIKIEHMIIKKIVKINLYLKSISGKSHETTPTIVETVANTNPIYFFITNSSFSLKKSKLQHLNYPTHSSAIHTVNLHSDFLRRLCGHG